MTKDTVKAKGKGKRSGGSSTPYDANNSRRSVRQGQMLSLNECEPMTDIQSHTISFPTQIPVSQLQISGATQSAANAEVSQYPIHEAVMNDTQVIPSPLVNNTLVESVDNLIPVNQSQLNSNLVHVNQVQQPMNPVEINQVDLPIISTTNNVVSVGQNQVPSTSVASQGVIVDNNNTSLVVNNNANDTVVHVNDKDKQNGPTMDQFLVLQNTILEMRKMMGNMTSNSSQSNSSGVENNLENLPVNTQVNNSVLAQNNDSNIATQVQNAPIRRQDVNTFNNQVITSQNMTNQQNVSQGQNIEIITGTGVNQVQSTQFTASGVNNMHSSANVINGTNMVAQPIGWLNNNLPHSSGPIDPNSILSQDQTQVNMSRQMQGAVGQHVQSLIGQLDSTGKESSYDDLGRPIDIRVSDKIRNQIWSNQYVDLSILVDPKSEVPDSLKWDGDSLCLAPHKSIKKLNGLGQWCDAFHIYICVYTRKYPNMIANLLTYMHNIKMLCNKGGDYMFYDEEYRTMRQRNPSNNWEINWDLWLECRDVRGSSNRSQTKRPNNNHTFRGQSANGSKPSHPAGYCFKFHNNGRCGNGANCTYKHTCYMSNCGERHAVFSCPKRGSKSNNKQNNNSTGSNGNNHPNKAN